MKRETSIGFWSSNLKITQFMNKELSNRHFLVWWCKLTSAVFVFKAIQTGMFKEAFLQRWHSINALNWITFWKSDENASIYWVQLIYLFISLNCIRPLSHSTHFKLFDDGIRLVFRHQNIQWDETLLSQHILHREMHSLHAQHRQSRAAQR